MSVRRVEVLKRFCPVVNHECFWKKTQYQISQYYFSLPLISIIGRIIKKKTKKKLKRNTGPKLSSQHNDGTWFMKSWKSWMMKITKSLNLEDKEKTKLKNRKWRKRIICGCKEETSFRYIITRFKYLNSWKKTTWGIGTKLYASSVAI